MKALKRKAHVRPGYDCGVRGDACKHAKQGDHGKHGDEWWYSVTGDVAALSITMFTGLYPAGREKLSNGKLADGADLTLHTTFPVSHEQLLSKPERCDLVRECYRAWTSGLAADEFFDAYGVQTFEQTETFWRALEAKYDKLLTGALSERVDETHEVCQRCEGKGYTSR